MPNTITVPKTITQIADGTPGQIVPPGDTLILPAQFGIYALGNGASPAIRADGANTITLDGDIYSRWAEGISGIGGNHTITVSATGSVLGFSAGIHLSLGGNMISNAGDVTSLNGMGIFANGGGLNSVINTGTIRAAFTGNLAVYLLGTQNSLDNAGYIGGSFGVYLGQGGVTNSGTIDAEILAVQFGGGDAYLENTETGTISNKGGNAAVVAVDAAKATVINKGLIQGPEGQVAVLLSLNADSYDGRGGRVIGKVQGHAGDDSLTGGSFADHLEGNDDNDTLTGGAGNDTLDGGPGNDKYMLNSDPVGDILADGSGNDTVFTTISRTIASWGFIENLVLQGAANIGAAGNGSNNVITGNGGNNIINAGAGGDTVLGGAGVDTINGGPDNDVLKGGVGNDTLIGAAGTDTLYGDGNDDVFKFNGISETVVGPGRDVVRDLDDAGNDRIDLSAMAGVSSFRGTGAFTAAGQVRIQQSGANVLVQINTTGTSVAEAEILIANATIGVGVGQVDAGDFIL